MDECADDVMKKRERKNKTKIKTRSTIGNHLKEGITNRLMVDLV